MLRISLIAAGALLAAAPIALTRSATLDGPEVGDHAPEISSGEWFNHIGRPLSLNNLRGHAVLIEFWATW